MSTEEGNKIIAEFMGWKHRKKAEHSYIFPNGIWDDDENQIGHRELLFHSSWDWVMMAWKKFRNLNLENNEYKTWIDSLSYYLFSSDTPQRFCERLYHAIQWYKTENYDSHIP